MADMLVETFGKSCEVVLHDLNRPEHSVVYVAGDVTHRKPGQNFDHLVKEVMLSDKLNNNYVAITILKSRVNLFVHPLN
ncbi:two-component response regulator involved in C4-dicarboxylate transport [Actinobacillus pleuropneumoniae]|nr:two-component response regulator involved in C4-dicarboxylate transport [Actinobacillus pleuropneumoniae]